MPKKDGLGALEEIKTHPEIRRIPIVVLTTSDAEEDIELSYDRGASSFITKPDTYQGLVEAMKCFGEYWTEIATLPGTTER
jgi:CheY-like chemotaxis protein